MPSPETPIDPRVLEGTSVGDAPAPQAEEHAGHSEQPKSMRELGRDIKRDWRNKRGLRATVAAMGVSIGLLGGDYALEGKRIRDEEAKLASQEQRYLELLRKDDRIKELFGVQADCRLDELHDEILEQQDLFLTRQDAHRVFPLGREESERYERVKRAAQERHAPAAEFAERQEGVQTSDLVTIEEEDGAREQRISAGQLRELLNYYPRGWVDTEIASITQSDLPDSLAEEYGIEGESAATCSTEVGETKSRIDFHRASQEENLYWVLTNYLPHEIGHANDWSTDEEMSVGERMDLLLAIADRLVSDDRYQSAYVEEINNPDKQQEFYLKATEYWAEICAQYFDLPEAMNIKDFALVDRVVRRGDPQYDVFACSDEQGSFVARIAFPKDHP